MLLEMSISGGTLILLIMVLRYSAINKLPKRTFTILWSIALARLLIPFSLPVGYGIAVPAVKAVDNTVNHAVNITGNLTGSLKTAPVKAQEEILAESFGRNITGITYPDWRTVLWLAGVILIFLFLITAYVREYRKLCQALPLDMEKENRLRRLGDIPSATKILVSDRIAAPLTFGFFFPKIILPKGLDLETDMEWKYVLTHERIHIQRRDNLRKLLLFGALGIHWFNPLVWAMGAVFSRDMELACDEEVLRCFGEDRRQGYAMTLLHLAEKQCHGPVFSAGFGKSAIQERIVGIMKFKKLTAAGLICTVLLTGAAITVFARTGETETEKTISYSDTKGAVENDTEGTFDNGEGIQAVRDSRDFPIYEKYGLSYNEKDGHLYYEGKTVGYFKDETSEDTYIRVTDEKGSIGIIVNRDDKNAITGLESVSIPWINAAGEGIQGDEVQTNTETAAEEIQIETGEEISEENETYVETAVEVSQENMEQKNLYIYGNIAQEDGMGNSSQVLKDYENLGFVYQPSKDQWNYKGRTVAGLIDEGNIYVDGSSDMGNQVSDPVYLYILDGKVKEISAGRFEELMNTQK